MSKKGTHCTQLAQIGWKFSCHPEIELFGRYEASMKVKWWKSSFHSLPNIHKVSLSVVQVGNSG